MVITRALWRLAVSPRLSQCIRVFVNLGLTNLHIQLMSQSPADPFRVLVSSTPNPSPIACLGFPEPRKTTVQRYGVLNPAEPYF